MSLDWRYVSHIGPSIGIGTVHRGLRGVAIPLRVDLALDFWKTERFDVQGNQLEDLDTPICGRFSNVFHRILFVISNPGGAEILNRVYYRRLNRVQFRSLSWTGAPLADPYPWPLLTLYGPPGDLCSWRTWKLADGTPRPDHGGALGYYELLSYLETYEEWMEAIPFEKSTGVGFGQITFWMDVDWKKATGSEDAPSVGEDYGFTVSSDFGVHLVGDRGFDP